MQFPFKDESFDAVISLATLEHIIDIDHHMNEIRRILKKDGDLFLSVPNYSGIHFVIPFLLKMAKHFTILQKVNYRGTNSTHMSDILLIYPLLIL